jgi:hypothetical protein
MWFGILICLLFPLQDLKLFLPDKIDNYTATGTPEEVVSDTRQIIKYYRFGNRNLTITLTDYKENPGLYQQITSIWQSNETVDNETMKTGIRFIKRYIAMETILKEEKTSEVMVAVKDRYIVTFNCNGAPLNEAAKLATQYKFEWLP